MKTVGRTQRRHRFIACAVLMVFLLPGCLHGPVDPEQREGAQLAPLGMGLMVPEVLPEPGPFLEDPEDLDVLKEFLLVEGKRMLAECGSPDGFSHVEFYLQDNLYYHAVYTLSSQCREENRKDLEYAEQAMREGNEREVHERLHAEAEAALAALEEKLIAHPGPGNAVEAQLLSTMYDPLYRGIFNQIAGAVKYWGYYQNSTSPSHNLMANALLGLLGAQGSSKALMMILDRYPWEETPCTPPDQQELAERLEQKMARVVELGEMHGEPGDETSYTAWHGDWLQWRQPNLESARDHGAWWALLAGEVRAEIHIAYWENRTQADSWPTMEEAEYLLALHRSQGRSMAEDQVLQEYVWFFGDEFLQESRDWQGNLVNGASAFMGKLAIRWPYADLDCPG